MLSEYFAIFLIFLTGIIFVLVAFLLSRLIHPRKQVHDKYVPYECGVDPDSDARERYSIKYYLIALLFIIFDIETALLFPWALRYERLALFGFLEMLVFLGVLIAGYFWVWKKGVIKYGAE